MKHLLLQCSRVCGGGTKFRKVRCQQLLALGEIADKPEKQCDKLKPDAERPCNPQPCNGYDYERDAAATTARPAAATAHDPGKKRRGRKSAIKANLNQAYVQDPAETTVKIKVGGRATLYEGTRLKIRCPVKKFDR